MPDSVYPRLTVWIVGLLGFHPGS